MPSLAELKDPTKYRHFTKRIVKSGIYTVPVDKKGGTREVEIPDARIDRWVLNNKRLLDNGRIVPFPLRHDLQAVPVPLREGVPDTKDTDAGTNAGFWLDLKKTVTNDGTYLEGVVAVPIGTKFEKDMVGKTILETSPLAQAKWTDGDNNIYEDVLTHIAGVTHPVTGKQSNFKQIPSTSEYIALSFDMLSSPEGTGEPEHKFTPYDAFGPSPPSGGKSPVTVGSSEKNVAGGENTPTNAANASVSDAVKVLKACGLALPDDTSADNLCQFIVVAGNALLANREKGGNGPESVNSPPGKSNDQPKTTALSMAGVEFDALPEPQKKAFRGIAANASKSYNARVSALARTGRATKEYVSEVLQPRLLNLALSFDEEGNAVNSDLEGVLSMLEKLPKGSVLTGMNSTGIKNSNKGNDTDEFALGTVREVPNADDNDAIPESVEEADDVVDQLFNNTGRSYGQKKEKQPA